MWEREKQVSCSMGLPFTDTSHKGCCAFLPYAAVNRLLVLEKEQTSMNVQPSLRASSPEHFLKECLVVAGLPAGGMKQS